MELGVRIEGHVAESTQIPCWRLLGKQERLNPPLSPVGKKTGGRVMQAQHSRAQQYPPPHTRLAMLHPS